VHEAIEIKKYLYFFMNEADIGSGATAFWEEPIVGQPLVFLPINPYNRLGMRV